MRSRHTFEPTDAHQSGNGEKGEACAAIGAHTLAPATCLLSNGRYHVMATNAGGGYSHWNNSALTRWQEDFTRDNLGVFIYVRDVDGNDFWSSAFQPTVRTAANYRASFSGAKARFDSDVGKVATRTDITVCVDDDIELRRVTVVNHADCRKALDLTSYAEVVLDRPATDDAHPAFSKLFVQTEIVPDVHAIICHRRGGNADERQPWLFHMVFAGPANEDGVSYETDRARFIGRGFTTSNPQAMIDPAPLSATQGSVLDPIVSIRSPFSLDPGQSAVVTYLFGVGDSREACLGLINKYRDQALIDRSFERANKQFASYLHDCKLTERDINAFNRLADSIIYGNAALRADPAIIAENERGQAGLWGFSISGDLPIVLLELGQSPKLDVASRLIHAHAYWRSRGLAVDLVICNAPGAPAQQALQDQVTKLARDGGSAAMLDKPGGVFVRLQTALTLEDRVLLKAVARVVLSDSGEALAEKLTGAATDPAAPIASRIKPTAKEGVLPPTDDTQHDLNLLFDNGLGGFSADGREYVITLGPGQATPAPWINILANPLFGTLVSESGCANTWSENAHEFLLTPWSNDPVGDSAGEAFYLRDEDTGRFWSPSPWPVRGAGTYVCRHGFGYSIFTHTEENIDSELRVYVARDAPIKFAALCVRNRSGRRRRLSAAGYVEWVLGDQRAKTMAHVNTRIAADSGALVARNPYSMDFGDRLAFFAVDDDVECTVTADRAEFLGRDGSPDNPAAMAQERLSGKAGAALDPCAAIQVAFELDNGQQKEIVFKLGAGCGDDEIRALLQRFKGASAARDELANVKKYWTRALGAIQVETPDKALDTLANGWLIYQVMASRLWGRTAFYQSSGAFGFRDQLQDVMALVHTEPGLVRDHIVLCASRQYPEGDVQHWWHPPVGRGVRTRCSDDYLWLALASCRYVSVTGDAGVLDEPIHFLKGRPLNRDEESYYELPAQSSDIATLYEHCVRAITHGLRFGVHGLPLMGTGDWNDGMNKVGAKGKGESIWLGFFLHAVLMQFCVLAQARGDTKFAALCEKEATELKRNLQEHGWDGAWFRRGYFDDGSVLGSAENTECRIDSIAQSWSVLSGATSKERMRLAMQAVDEQLVAPENAVIKLLAPPFDTSNPYPGYIQAYVPGVRENGGQYTHAAVWSVMAFAALHDNQRTWELLSMLNPINHGASPEAAALYKAEPYVVASDVYALAPHAGRGGWTWYSGSAGWLYRLAVESVLGIRRQANKLSIEPCVPLDWQSYKISYRFGESVYVITLQQQTGTEVVPRLMLDGVAQDASFIALVDDGLEHRVQMRLVSQDI